MKTHSPKIMPWSLQIAGKDKATLLGHIATRDDLPVFVVRALRDIIMAMPDSVGLNVTAAGYSEPHSGLIEIKVHMLNVL